MAAPAIIRIDPDKCICSQNCVRLAPRTFDIGEDDIAMHLAGPDDPIERIREAVAACPVGAISILEPIEAK
jgi:ferredoxin